MAESAKLIGSSAHITEALAAGEALFRQFLAHHRQSDRNLLHDWLDSFRGEQRLTAIRQAGLEDRWFDLVVRIITATDYTVGELFRRRAARYEDRPLFLTLSDERVEEYSWAEIARNVDEVAAGLLTLGAQEAPVIFFCNNSLEMAIADLACLTRGIVNAVVPGNASAGYVAQVLKQIGARIGLIGDEKQLATIMSAASASALKYLILLHGESDPADDRIITFERLRRLGSRFGGEFPHPRASDLATIMFTSGTTGDPKGVCFTHLNIVCKRFARSLALPFVGEDNVFLSYLPLFHTFGRWLEMLGTIFWGGRYAFCQNPSTRTLLENMRRVRATGFISVPLKWMQIRDEVGRCLNLDEVSQEAISEQLRRLTGGKLRWGLSAAGHLEEEVFAFFHRAGLDLMSGYGMTEATGGITMTPPGAYRAGTVGIALPGIELHCADDGELLVRGPYVVSHLLGAEGDREPILSDGWLHTGDVVSIDRDGYVTLVDRKKDLYKNLRGETIAPQRIESFFADFPGVAQAFLVGDHRPFNTLLLVPDMNDESLPLRHLSPSQLKEFFRPYVVSVNRFLARHERVVDYTVLNTGFSVASGELTPKGTYRRKVIVERRKHDIEPMYRRKHLNIEMGGLRLRVPHWFLREKGVTESDVCVEGNRLILRSTGESLIVCRELDSPSTLRIGSLGYVCESRAVDLDRWLRSASLWVGNGDLVAFAGEGIVHWRAALMPSSPSINPRRFYPVGAPLRSFPASIASGPAGTLLDLHAASCILANSIANSSRLPDDEAVLYAVAHLRKVCLRGSYEFALLAKERLSWAAYHYSYAVRSLAYRSLLEAEADEGDEKFFRAFIDSGKPFLDPSAIEAICEARLDDMQLSALRARLEKYRREFPLPLAPPHREQFKHLIDLLTQYGIAHPETYAIVRSELASWLFLQGEEDLKQRAKAALEQLTTAFRTYLLSEAGQKPILPRQTIFEFELGIDDGERRRIEHAFRETSLLPETIYVLFDGKRISLEDLCGGSIWVSQRGGRFGSFLYHVTVETEAGERYEFDLALNRSQLEEHFRMTELLRARCGDLPHGPPTLARLGGFWSEIGIATREELGGEALMNFWKRVSRFQREEPKEELCWECVHYLHLALACCIEFWKLTGFAYMLSAPSPRDVMVVTGQTTKQVRLFNIADRVPYSDIYDFALSLYRGFFHPLWHECPSLRHLLDAGYVYEAFVDVLGEEEAARAFDATPPRAHLQRFRDPATGDDVLSRFREVQKSIREKGFRPFALQEAVRDYHRWLALNPDATPEARLATVAGIYRWHRLREVEQKFPEVRLRLFRETLWAEEGPPLGTAMDEAIQKLRGQREVQQQIVRFVSELRLDYPLPEEYERYLTWLCFPHLSCRERAKIIPMRAGDRITTPLSTTLTDSAGESYEFRDALSPAEEARLIYLMRRAGLSVPQEPEQQVQVLLDARGTVVGGLVYLRTSPHHAIIHSLVVTNTLRDRNLGRLMVEDTLARLSAQEVRVVSVDFVLPEFWKELGFRPNAEYGGLTKMLHSA